jgi:hypothetical protein
VEDADSVVVSGVFFSPRIWFVGPQGNMSGPTFSPAMFSIGTPAERFEESFAGIGVDGWYRGTGKKGCFWGSGSLGSLSGRYIRIVIKSPQFRFILAKGEDRDQDRSQKS